MDESTAEEIVKMYERGTGVTAISRSFCIGVQRVRELLKERGVLRTRSDATRLRWANKNNVVLPPKREGATISAEQVMEMFEAGRNPSQIAAELHVDARRVRRIVVDAGLLESDLCRKTCKVCDKPFLGQANSQHCKDCIPNGRFMRAFKHRGVSKPVWDQLLSAQGGHCALCPREPTVIDHCHKTGKTRGILCNRCNTSLNPIDDDPSWAERALAYVARVPPQKETAEGSP
jgi:hypothetical protein